MIERILIHVIVLAFALILTNKSMGQEPMATPSSLPSTERPAIEEQEILKVDVEEVRIPVFAFDERRRFDPTLAVDDLLVREDGLAQRLRGVYRVPAYVLVLADTGGELNPVKTVRLTGSVAVGLVSALRPDDWIAVMQVNSVVELLKGWSRDGPKVIEAIRTKLLPSKRSSLGEGLVRAAGYLREAPTGNRHLVIISDGYDGGGRVDLHRAMKDLASSNITVHIISYTSLGRKAPLPPVTYAKAKSSVPEEIAITAPAMRDPSAYTPDMKDLDHARGAFAIDLDRLFHRSRHIKDELAGRETEFEELAEETAGVAWLPITMKEMLAQAAEVARDIDAQYVVTYRPKRPLAEAKVGESRRLDVISRRVGLYVRSRRGFVVNTGLP